eukprot:465267-Amphidinium_carterae.2
MAEIQKLEEEIAANKQAQAEATALRRKQNAAYMGESVETKQALAALEDAIAVLVKVSRIVKHEPFMCDVCVCLSCMYSSIALVFALAAKQSDMMEAQDGRVAACSHARVQNASGQLSPEGEVFEEELLQPECKGQRNASQGSCLLAKEATGGKADLIQDMCTVATALTIARMQIKRSRMILI